VDGVSGLNVFTGIKLQNVSRPSQLLGERNHHSCARKAVSYRHRGLCCFPGLERRTGAGIYQRKNGAQQVFEYFFVNRGSMTEGDKKVQTGNKLRINAKMRRRKGATGPREVKGVSISRSSPDSYRESALELAPAFGRGVDGESASKQLHLTRILRTGTVIENPNGIPPQSPRLLRPPKCF
jgi:hypothetical protein